jgi:hypothetical protein
MNTFFTTKVKYAKQLDNGALKRVTEPYLVAAHSFTDAEARIYDELGDTIRGEFHITAISKTEVHDIFFYDDADTFYKVKAKYQSEDIDSGKSKKVSQNFLVTANSVEQAAERINEHLYGSVVDFEIVSVVVSPIVDVFTQGISGILEAPEYSVLKMGIVFSLNNVQEVEKRYCEYIGDDSFTIDAIPFCLEDFKEWARKYATDLVTILD